MRGYEQLCNLVWILLAFGICAYSVRLKVWDPSGPASGFVPFVAGAMIGMIGLLLFARGRTGDAGRVASWTFWENRAGGKRVVAILAGLAAMASLLPILGFVLTSVLVMTFLLRVIERQKLSVVIAGALVSSFSVYWLFRSLLQVSLPRGVVGF